MQDNLITSIHYIDNALKEIAEMSPQQTDGKWLEVLTVASAPLIAEWDVSKCWLWNDWPEREQYFRRAIDIGVDVVARRKSDGALIAIQCKSRQLDHNGHGNDIMKSELDSFLTASAGEYWKERWLVTNGGAGFSGNAAAVILPDKPVKLINIASDLHKQKDAIQALEGPEEYLNYSDDGRQTRDGMQREAIEKSIKLLEAHAITGRGRSRGRIILPCGTGKSRIALRIIEQMTQPGEVSAVLCPSIALVAQLRREFLCSTQVSLSALAVCSDASAGHSSSQSPPPPPPPI